MKQKLTITIDPEVVKQVDKERGLVPRSTWIEHKLSNKDGGAH